MSPRAAENSSALEPAHLGLGISTPRLKSINSPNHFLSPFRLRNAAPSSTHWKLAKYVERRSSRDDMNSGIGRNFHQRASRLFFSGQSQSQTSSRTLSKSYNRTVSTLSRKMKHHLMVGTWTPPGAIFTFEFDDESLSLKLIKRTPIPEDEPISWMTFDHSKKTIYGAAMKKWSSYTVQSPTEIVHTASHPMEHDPLAASKDTNTRAIFVLAAQKPPFNVYGNPFYDHAGWGNNFSVNQEGTLEKCVQNFEYMPKTGIHGMVFDASETYLYSADLRGNKVWTHKKDENGHLTLVGCVEAPDPLDHPRWVALHQNYLYVLMEAGNRLAVYVIDEQTHCPTFTHITYPLIPPGIPNSKTMYRSDVVFLSHSKQYLFATARSNSRDLTGYIAAFKLGPAGNIERQICLNPTPTSGGHSNAVSPWPYSDEYLALTDDQDGWIEIYRWKDEFLGRVAHCDVKEPGFGMNAIWYD